MKKLSRSLVILMAALALTACGNSEKAAPSGGNTSDDSSDLNVISDNSSDKLNTEPLITHTYPLSRIAEAYALFENRQDGVIKVAVEC